MRSCANSLTEILSEVYHDYLLDFNEKNNNWFTNEEILEKVERFLKTGLEITIPINVFRYYNLVVTDPEWQINLYEYKNGDKL